MFTNAILTYVRTVREELRSCLIQQGFSTAPTAVIRLFSEEMKNALLREAVRFAECSLSNIAHASQLLQRDYMAWPVVTYYYASFYALCTLLRARGYAITYIGSRAYQVEPDPASPGRWWFILPSNDRGHAGVWSQYEACFSQNPPADWDNLKALSNPDERTIRVQHNYQPDIMGEELHWGTQRRSENATLLRTDLYNASEANLRTAEQLLLRRSQRRAVAATEAVVAVLHQTGLESVYVEGMRRLRRAFNQYNNLLPTTLRYQL